MRIVHRRGHTRLAAADFIIQHGIAVSQSAEMPVRLLQVPQLVGGGGKDVVKILRQMAHVVLPRVCVATNVGRLGSASHRGDCVSAAGLCRAATRGWRHGNIAVP